MKKTTIFETLQVAAKPLRDFLAENYDPMVCACVTAESITVLRAIAGTPIDESGQPEG